MQDLGQAGALALSVLERLPRASLEGAVFILAVALVCRVAPRLRAAHRTALWWLASAKLLLGLLPIAPLSFAVLPASQSTWRPAGTAPAGIGRAADPGRASPDRPGDTGAARSWLAWAWLAGGGGLLAASCRGAVHARRWRRSGRAPSDPVLIAAVSRAAGTAGLGRVPQVLVVPELPSPLVTGLVRPVVLLPLEALERLSASEVEMTLAHEMAHVARHDLWLGLVPSLSRRLFFFHPLAWLAEREYAIAREAACDEAVLVRPEANPFAYGRLLLRLGARSVASTAALSPRSMLRRRLEMIESVVHRAPLGRRAAWALLALAAVAFLPLRLVAADPPTPRPPARSERLAAELGPCLDVGGRGTDTAYVIRDGDTRTMCGDQRDLRAAERARRGDADVFWFRIDDTAYVIRDPATIAEARELFAPQSEIGERQSSLGEKQAAIGEQQSELGEQQARLGEQQARVGERQARLTPREDGADVDDALDALSEKMQALGEGMATLGEELGRLGELQSALGEQQAVLAEEMLERAVEAQKQLGRLVERALEQGLAEPVRGRSL